MTTITATRSIKHDLPYNAASTRSSHTMVTMITTLTILGKSNWNKMEIYLMLWMWWRMWQTYTTTMTQMMTVTTTTLMRKRIPKTKRICILPTHKWEDGDYGQRLSHRCRNRNRFFLVVVVACMSFPQTLAKVCVCFWCVGSLFGCFLECLCLWSEFLFLSITSA